MEVVGRMAAQGDDKMWPKHVDFLLTTDCNCWCVVGSYIPYNEQPVVHRVKQSLALLPAPIYILLMGDLNTQIKRPREHCKGGLVTSIAAHGLEDQAQHFLSQRQ